VGYCKERLMKYFSLIILTLFFISCSVTNKLNRQIDQSQKASLKDSPFETANGMFADLKIQLKYRRQYANEIYELIKLNKNDTIILTENYDFICYGCRASINVFYDNTLVWYEWGKTAKNYIEHVEVLSDDFVDTTGYFYSDIFEIKNEIKKGSTWNNNPEKYGTDSCLDGGHTFYTVFYPTGKVESMYMRCWTPKELRKKK